jgi:hypothetical protein
MPGSNNSNSISLFNVKDDLLKSKDADVTQLLIYFSS